jgi:hypothetical protein
MMLQEVKFRGLYRHKLTRIVYQVVVPVDYTTQMKLDDSAWIPAVIYQRAERPIGVNVRDLEHFKKNFEEVK